MKLLALAGITLIAAATTPAAAQKLSQSQVESLLRGFSVDGRSERLGGAGTFTFNHDGTLRIDLRGRDRSPIRGRGTYRFANGGFCATSPLLGGGERCFSLHRINPRSIEVRDAAGAIEMVLEPGATEP